MLMAVAVPAMVEINPLAISTWPTISGKVYTSDAAKVLVLVIKFWLPAVSAAVTKLTLKVAAVALKLVAVNLSMIVVTLVAVYCVVWAFSAVLAGIKTLTVTVNLILLS